MGLESPPNPNPLAGLAIDFIRAAAGPQQDAGVEELYSLRLAIRTYRVSLSLHEQNNSSLATATAARWISKKLGKARDLDVIHARITDEASASTRSNLKLAQKLVHLAAKERIAARFDVAHALGSTRFVELAAAMEAIVSEPLHNNNNNGNNTCSAAVACASFCARRHETVAKVWHAAGRALESRTDAVFHRLRSLARSARILLSLSRAGARGRICARPAPVSLRLASAIFDHRSAASHCVSGRISDAHLIGGWLREKAQVFRAEGNKKAAKLAASFARREVRRGRAARRKVFLSVRSLRKAAAALLREPCP